MALCVRCDGIQEMEKMIPGLFQNCQFVNRDAGLGIRRKTSPTFRLSGKVDRGASLKDDDQSAGNGCCGCNHPTWSTVGQFTKVALAV